MADKQPIIVIKRKSQHGGHHGGAWKVAYADFVTAMMALFIVLWLLNTSKQLQEAIGGYFKDPTGTSKMVGTNLSGAGENFDLSKKNIIKLKEELEKAVRKVSNFDKLKNQITMTVTAEGLRIELVETEKGTFFDIGSKEPNGDGRGLLIALANELGKFPNKLSIEGHTDSKPYSGAIGYSNWDLSSDRANATRKLIQANGVRSDQVSQIRGFADQFLKYPKDPDNPANRRISMIVQYLPHDTPEQTALPERPGAPPPPASGSYQAGESLHDAAKHQ